MQQPEETLETATGQQKAGGADVAVPIVSANDLYLIEALRNGDESAFVSLIDQYHTAMLRLALVYVPNHQVAEEVVQETWMGVLLGINRFEARSSLKTWIFRILSNCAKTRGQREGRGIPFSALPEFDTEPDEPAVDPERFRPPGARWPGHWVSFPKSWDEVPEDRLLSQETLAHINEAIDALPTKQKEVITLRDIEGWTSDEVCHFLGLTEANQRVLLHRARSRVRRALEQYFEEE
jgi:RNA polymerase sigma-70 factor (ECF subfamily)